MSVIRWEEPGPEPQQDEDLWAHEVVAELRTRPGEWAVVLECTAEERDKARAALHALTGQRRVWPAVRWRGPVLTLFACWSEDRPEPSSETATVYSFPQSSSGRQPPADVSVDTANSRSDRSHWRWPWRR